MMDPALQRIARPGHLHKMARSGDRPQSKPKRAASATAAVREPPELVANVRDVAVHRVRAQEQLLGDLLIVQPVRDQRQHFALSARAAPPRAPARRAGASGASTERTRAPPLANRQSKGDGRCRREEPASPPVWPLRAPAETVRNGAVAAVHHQRRCM